MQLKGKLNLTYPVKYPNIITYFRDISGAFTSGDIQQVRAVVSQAKYYLNVLDKITEIERDDGIVD